MNQANLRPVEIDGKVYFESAGVIDLIALLDKGADLLLEIKKAVEFEVVDDIR